MEETQVNALVDRTRTELTEARDEQFRLLEQRLNNKMKRLEQIVSGAESEEEIDLIQPYERNVSAETRPQMSSAAIKETNKHISHLSNHELQQVKAYHDKDHSKPVKTILDEPLGQILDHTINFLTYSFDSFSKKIYEAELMEDVHSTDKNTWNNLKVLTMATVLFIRDEQNIIYIGIIMVFLSIIIYFINIITFG